MNRNIKIAIGNTLRALSLILLVLVMAACHDTASSYDTPRTQGGTLEDVNTGLSKVNIETPQGQAITSKEDWIADATMTIYDTDGTETSYKTSVKGRGNSTWEQAKKRAIIGL